MQRIRLGWLARAADSARRLGWVSDTRTRRYWLVPAALAACGGLACWTAAAYYGFRYVSEPGNPARIELTMGATMGLLASTPFWLATAAAVAPIKTQLPRIAYLLAIGPGVLLATWLVGVVIYIGARAAFG